MLYHPRNIFCPLFKLFMVDMSASDNVTADSLPSSVKPFRASMFSFRRPSFSDLITGNIPF